MSKAVLISIRPKWCELIASGRKTIEIRKTRPEIEIPFKCYIYCTKAKSTFDNMWTHSIFNPSDKGNGKVIGEFVCDGMTMLKADNMIQAYFNNACETCLSDAELRQYATEGKPLYYWHISDLVIYDKPKELGEFLTNCRNRHCSDCAHGIERTLCFDENKTFTEFDCFYDGYKPIERPPQSWCYVEEV